MLEVDYVSMEQITSETSKSAFSSGIVVLILLIACFAIMAEFAK
ncbi:MAG: hypothetical protein QXO67_02110 [Candidatus Bathyarchaeia archaeon]